MEKKKVTTGRDYLGNFAPLFATLNDDVLFGKIWSREENLSARDRSMITISALMGAGILDTSLKGHLEKAKENGITKEEIVEIITQLAFYVGWPKAWSAFAMAMEVYENGISDVHSLFGMGNIHEDYEHFSGKVYIKEIWSFDKPVLIDNVTFEPGCINNWHIHKAGQTLFVTDGIGYYQEYGKPAIKLHKGDIVEIPAGVKHWHGASKDSFFSHLAIEDYSKGEPEWLEKVSELPKD